MGQSRGFWLVNPMSPVPPIATAERTCRDVCLVPIADIQSITSSAATNTDCGTDSPRMRAVCRLITSSNLVA